MVRVLASIPKLKGSNVKSGVVVDQIFSLKFLELVFMLIMWAIYLG
jgi:hypothetical protein